MMAMALAVFGGCASRPAADTAGIVAPPGLGLPLATRVALQVDPDMPAMQVVEFRGATWQYPDAELMVQAALQVFGKVFQELAIAPMAAAPVITLQLNGSSSLNPVLSEYHANASVTVFAGADPLYDSPLAFIPGTGQAGEPAPDDGIRRAYAEAFRRIAEVLLADPYLLAILRGY
jgi:hypothetical protein